MRDVRSANAIGRIAVIVALTILGHSLPDAAAAKPPRRVIRAAVSTPEVAWEDFRLYPTTTTWRRVYSPPREPQGVRRYRPAERKTFWFAPVFAYRARPRLGFVGPGYGGIGFVGIPYRGFWLNRW